MILLRSFTGLKTAQRVSLQPRIFSCGLSRSSVLFAKDKDDRFNPSEFFNFSKKSNASPDMFNTNPPPAPLLEKETATLDTSQVDFDDLFSSLPKKGEKPEEPFKFPTDDMTDSILDTLNFKKAKPKESLEKEDVLFDILRKSLEQDKRPTSPTPKVDLMGLIFGKTRKTPILDLTYWDLYPKQIKKWILFTKSSQGYYDLFGKWVSTQSLENYRNLNAPPTTSEADKEKWEEVYQKEQLDLPPDLRGHYRFSVEYDEIKDIHPKIRRLFSFKFATVGEILKHRKQVAIKKWQKHPLDTASDAIQIDILTQRIRHIHNFLLTNKQDKAGFRTLAKLKKRRKGLMGHLKKKDIHTYFSVLREVRLQELYPFYNIKHRYQ